MGIIVWKFSNQYCAKLIRNDKTDRLHWKIINLRPDADYEVCKKELDVELKNNLSRLNSYIKDCDATWETDHCGNGLNWPEYHKQIHRWGGLSKRQSFWMKENNRRLTDYAVRQGMKGLKEFAGMDITKEAVPTEIIEARRQVVKTKRMLRQLKTMMEAKQ